MVSNIVEDEEASNSRAIDSARNARAIYEVYIPRRGKWYVWIRTYYKSGSQDSYWLGIDDVEPYPWDEEGGPNAIKIWAIPGDDSKCESLDMGYFNTPAWKSQNRATLESNVQDITVYGQKVENRVHG